VLRRIASLLALLLALLLVPVLACGCATTIAGTARPVPRMGLGLKQALLDSPGLSTMLNQPFEAVPHFSHTGGRELLGDRTGSPADCVGVVFMLQKADYQAAAIKDIADEGWAHADRAVKVDMVVEAIVALPTPAEAAALFGKLSAQWRRCDGTTMTLPGDVWPQNVITDVRVTETVAAATVSRKAEGDPPILTAIPEARALGVQGNCLVEVDMMFTPVSYPDDQGSADINTSAVDIAHAIMDRLRAPK
jgi:hypothetical protein